MEIATVGRLTLSLSSKMKTIRGHPGTIWRKTCIRRAVLTVDADAPIRGPRVARQAEVRMDGRTADDILCGGAGAISSTDSPSVYVALV